jgi:hypothetical protein
VAEDDWRGMGTGIAKKLGNAGGAKVLTTFETRRETFAIYKDGRTNGKRSFEDKEEG